MFLPDNFEMPVLTCGFGCMRKTTAPNPFRNLSKYKHFSHLPWAMQKQDKKPVGLGCLPCYGNWLGSGWADKYHGNPEEYKTAKAAQPEIGKIYENGRGQFIQMSNNGEVGPRLRAAKKKSQVGTWQDKLEKLREADTSLLHRQGKETRKRSKMLIMNEKRYMETHKNHTFAQDKLQAKPRPLQGKMQMTVICSGDPEGEQEYFEDEVDGTIMETKVDHSSTVLDPLQLLRKKQNLEQSYEAMKENMGKYGDTSSHAPAVDACAEEVDDGAEEELDDEDSDGDCLDFAPSDPRMFGQEDIGADKPAQKPAGSGKAKVGAAAATAAAAVAPASTPRRTSQTVQ